MINFIVQDRQVILSDDEKARLTSIVGAAKIDSCIMARDEFTLNSAVLEQTVTIHVADAKGKKTEKTNTVMNLLAEVIQERFAELPELVSQLFTVKPVQKTAKGLIDRALEFAGDQYSLQTFMDAIKTVRQLKPVGARS